MSVLSVLKKLSAANYYAEYEYDHTECTAECRESGDDLDELLGIGMVGDSPESSLGAELLDEIYPGEEEK